jgi:putative toxin-antitoxin system antitoxin component (TIGR02293 family)
MRHLKCLEQCVDCADTTNGVIIDDIMVNELTIIVDELGGESSFGKTVRTNEEMSTAIRAGFPHSAVERFLESSGLSMQEIASSLDLSIRSLQRRKHEGRLARYESDRLYRLARLVVLAEHYLGDHERAIEWLRRPNHVLGGVAPLKIVDTELGARQVENVLGRIGYGGVS